MNACCPAWRGATTTLLALLTTALPASSFATEAQGREAAARGGFVEVPAAVVQDKIRGGLVAQILGNLNGTRHEARYIEEPGEVEGYVPGLPEGARTDDDTDIEWVYVVAMERSGELFLDPAEIAELWRRHINRRIWSSNQYVRQLIDLGIEPPLTGSGVLNPWASFNLAGQFLSETFALMAPAMPTSAAQLALHYTRVSIDGEPAQTTQLFAAMIARAFRVDDVDELLDAGLQAVDPASRVRRVVEKVRAWHRRHPEDWRTVRRLIRDAYTRHGGEVRDANGYELNTAATVAALLYGGGELVPTLETAFRFGWDADNNAATAATIVGVIKGERWIRDQGWPIADRYRNTTRDGMPRDETLSAFGDRIVGLARQVLAWRGGQVIGSAGEAVWRIPLEDPSNVEALVSTEERRRELRSAKAKEIRALLSSAPGSRELARAAYLGIALELASELRRERPQAWARAVDALGEFPQVGQALFHRSPVPEGEALRGRAREAGWEGPEEKEPIWKQDFSFYDAQDPPELASLPALDRLRHYHQAVGHAFTVANIDSVVESTLRLHRVGHELARDSRQAAQSLETMAGRPFGARGVDGVESEAVRALRDVLGAAAAAAVLAAESQEDLASTASLLERAAGQIETAVNEVRRGVELGERGPIVAGLESLSEPLEALGRWRSQGPQ